MQMLHSPMAVYIVLIISFGLLLTVHTIFQIQMMTFLQILTPEDLVGKVIACFMCVVMGTMPLGQVVYGFAFEHIGGSMYLLLYFAGFIMIIISTLTHGVFTGVDRQIEKSRI